MKATPVSAPPPKPKPVELTPSEEYKKGLEDIGQQLTELADYLPLIKQCMRDVKNGYYTTTTAGHIANNGVVDSVIDPWSGKIVKVEAKTPEKQGINSEVFEFPPHVMSGESMDGNGQ